MTSRTFSYTLAKIAGVAVVAIVLMCKLWHQQCSPADLQVFLYLVQKAVSLLHSVPSVYAGSMGYYFPNLAIVIDKSCAGVNFFLLTFGLLSLMLLSRARTGVQVAKAVTVSVFVSYALTELVNILRICGAVRLSRWEENFRWLASGWFHEAYGASLYMLALASVYTYFQKSGKLDLHLNVK
ncbi:MAG: exosortase K, partial [Bacteroidia bacterium]|nr:exosortase K [Bacteroidia bacterium]